MREWIAIIDYGLEWWLMIASNQPSLSEVCLHCSQSDFMITLAILYSVSLAGKTKKSRPTHDGTMNYITPHCQVIGLLGIELVVWLRVSWYYTEQNDTRVTRDQTKNYITPKNQVIGRIWSRFAVVTDHSQTEDIGTCPITNRRNSITLPSRCQHNLAVWSRRRLACEVLDLDGTYLG